MTYRPKIIKGIVKNTGYPIDGHVLYFLQWGYDNHENWHLYDWLGETTDEAVMRTMYQTETEAGLCLYDTLEEFMRAWEEEEWEAQGTFCLTLEQVEVLKVLQEEHTEEN